MAIRKRTKVPISERSLLKKKVIAALSKKKKQRRFARDQYKLRLRMADRLPEQIDITVLLRLMRGFYGSGYGPTIKAPEVISEYRRGLHRQIDGEASAIKARCAECQGATNKLEAKTLVAQCDDMKCPLWLFRLGDNPFYNKR